MPDARQWGPGNVSELRPGPHQPASGPRLRIRIGDEECIAELFRDEAPSLTATLERVLPHATLATHAQTAGKELCLPLPFFHWHENRRLPRLGEIGYASFNNYLCIYYGEMDPNDGATNVVGRVVEGFDCVERAGARLLHGTFLLARVAVLGAEAQAEHLPPVPQPATAFTSVARAFLERTISGVPDDIRHLRAVQKLAMGNIAARFHASTALLAITDNLLLCRTQAVQDGMPLPYVNTFAAALTRRSTRWLTNAGLLDAAGIARALAEWLETEDAPTTGEEFASGVDDVLVALGRLRIWVDAVTPWARLSGDYLPDSAWLDLPETDSW